MSKFKSDVNLGDFIFISKTSLAQDRKQCVLIADIINRSFPEFFRLLDIPVNVKFRIGHLINCKGKYNSIDTIALISPVSHRDYFQYLMTVAHELVHAEQFKLGKLQAVLTPSQKWIALWEGQEVNFKVKSYEKYKALPWEQEAFDRQERLAKIVNERLEEQYETQI